MQSHNIVFVGGVCFIIGAIAFVSVFSYLAAKFDYPKVLDGRAEDVLPRLRAGGERMRAVWAIYSMLPLLLIVGAAGIAFALSTSPGYAFTGAVFATVGSLAMCLGLMRWPSIHWKLAEAWESAGEESRHSIAAMFSGLNLYLGNYIGEFLGELCLGVFFLLSALGMHADTRFASWLGIAGIIFSISFLVGAFRNVTGRLQLIADINNYLLPLWLIVLGSTCVWIAM